MIKKTFLLVFTLVLFSPPGTLRAQSEIEINAVIMNDSKLRINGTSNVTDFQCNYEEELQADTLFFAYDLTDSVSTVRGDKLNLTIEAFDCGKRGINRDFRKTLRSSVFPQIEVELLKVYIDQGIPNKAEVLIELAGKTQPYLVTLKEFKIEDKMTYVEGEQLVRMSDFGLDPPSALFGLIKVRDELRIGFTLEVLKL